MMAVYSKEKMSVLVKWVFTLPMTYVIYFVFSLIIPQVGMASLVMRYGLMICVFLFLSTRFLSFDWRRFLRCNFPQSRFSWKKLLAATGAMFCLLSALTLVRMIGRPWNFYKSFDPSRIKDMFAPVILVLVAAFSEELMFRGYVAFFGGREPGQSIPCCLVSGLLFALAHFENPEVSSMGLVSMLFYFVFGAILMYIYLKDGGIELALGIHIGNNLVPALLFTYPGAVVTTNAIYTVKQSAAEQFIACAAVLAFFIFLYKGERSPEDL